MIKTFFKNREYPRTKKSLFGGNPSIPCKTHSQFLNNSDGSGSKFFDPGRVNFLWLGSGQVSHLWFGLEFGKFPLKMSKFSIFFHSGQKKLLRVGLESTRVKAR